MASRETNPDKKNEEIGSDIPDLSSKIPGKLVSAKRANAGKLNLHLVSSTPMNPAKRAKFFDESNLFGSPIKSGGSSSDINTNSPDNKMKNLESDKDKNINKIMPYEEQAENGSPFPFITKLSIKKMTICASDEDTDEDDIFADPKVTKKVLLDTDEDLNFDMPDSRINHTKSTEAIVEPARKVTSREEIKNKIEKKITKNVQIKQVNVKANENVLKTTRVTKSNDDNKENENTENNEMKPKSKSEPANKNIKSKQTDNNKPSVDISPKQRKLNDHTVQKKRMTKTIIEKDISSAKATNKKLPLANNTKIKTAKRSMKSPDNGVRKSARSCASTVPYWMAPWHQSESVSDEAKRSKSEEIDNNTMISVKDTNRPKSVPETVIKIKEPKRVDEKLESTVTLNRTKTRSESEPNKKNIKKKSNETNVTNILNRSKTKMKKPEQEKKNIKKESDARNDKKVTLNKSENKLKIKRSEKKSSFIHEDPETTKKLNKSKIKDDEKKTKESQKNVIKSNKNDTQAKEIVSNVQENKKRQYPKEILDKENKEKQNKVENIAAKSVSSPTKSNSRSSLQQTVLENEVFEPNIQEIDDDLLRSYVQESFAENNKSEVHRSMLLGTKLNSSRTSRRIKKINKKDTNKIEYTPGIVLKQNKNDAKTTLKKKSTNTENMIENRALRSKTSNTKKPNKYVDNIELEENTSEKEDLPNSDNSNDNQQRKIRKRRMIIPVNSRSKTSIQASRASKMKKHFNDKSSKQVNFNVIDSEISNSFESDSLSSHENPSKMSCKASYNYNKNPPRKFSRSSRDSKYPRRTLFSKHDSTLDESDDSWTSGEDYVPRTKKRKYMTRKNYNKRKVSGFVNFKESALEVQVPAVRRTLTRVQLRGKNMLMECYGNFPRSMTKINAQSSLRGTCFMNEVFASGMMEITLGTIKKCNASNNHTYFIILDGMAEIGIADSVKIMRIGDCCIVPKHTFYYIANASSEVNLLLNFLKISL